MIGVVVINFTSFFGELHYYAKYHVNRRREDTYIFSERKG